MSVEDRIAAVTNNPPLASAIVQSISSALEHPPRANLGADNVLDVFEMSLRAAIYDIEKHPRSDLFKRLVRHGPLNPDDPPITEGSETVLSDAECGQCVQYVYSHMVNRFKGEVAELLSLGPCVELIRLLVERGRIHSDAVLHWGALVREPSKQMRTSGRKAFVKGADLLLTAGRPESGRKQSVAVLGVGEVKSYRAGPKVLRQVESHLSRLANGLMIGPVEYSADEIVVDPSDLLRIVIMPSSWRLSRTLTPQDERPGAIVYADPCGTPSEVEMSEIKLNLWNIVLGWSQEAIEQAAYEMTFWYMSEIGKHVYEETGVPREWAEMTPEEAGMNATKMALYYFPLRLLSKSQVRTAVRLYNIYGFGYPLGVDYARRGQMIWYEKGELVGQSIV